MGCETVKSDDTDYANLKDLCKVKLELQESLRQKCRNVAWERVKKWGCAPDVLMKKCFHSWDTATSWLSVENRTVEPQRIFDEMTDEFREELEQILKLEKKRDRAKNDRDDALAEILKYDEMIQHAISTQERDKIKKRKIHERFLEDSEKQVGREIDLLDVDKQNEMDERRKKLKLRQAELEKQLHQLEAKFGKNFVRRVVPSSKGVKCVGCQKQMLFRSGKYKLSGVHQAECSEVDLLDKSLVAGSGGFASGARVSDAARGTEVRDRFGNVVSGDRLVPSPSKGSNLVSRSNLNEKSLKDEKIVEGLGIDPALASIRNDIKALNKIHSKCSWR